MSKTSLVLFLGLGLAVEGGAALIVEPPSTDPQHRVAAVLHRHRQIPLGEDEALAAAALAREVGDRGAEIELLERATAGGDLAEVARVELAQVVVGEEPGRALDLVLPTLERAATSQLRDTAAEIAVRAIGPDIDAQQRRDLERVAGRLTRSLRRMVQGVLADVATPAGRRQLVALIRDNPGDGAALAAARRLEALPDVTDYEVWQVARCVYQHALYAQAAPLLEGLLGGALNGIPGWEVAFVRGRCAFRVDDWKAAASWYQRALGMTTNSRHRAELEVHLARSFELAGRVDEATEAARRAVVADTTDSRRLFLARLRLRTGKFDLAEAGIASIRRGSNRARGRLLVALHHLKEGDEEKAVAMLHAVSRRPWRGPARVLEAQRLVRAGRPAEAVDRLHEVVGELDGFWASQARQVMAALPTEILDRWRVERMQSLEEGSTSGRIELVRLAALEPDRAHSSEIRRLVADLRPLPGVDSKPHGIAARLWDLGLSRAAVRWDPAGFPTATPPETVWSASAFLAAGDPARAIRTADAAWRSLGSDIAPQFYGRPLMSALYPLPDPEALLKAAGSGVVDPSLVAGVVREESRWDPKVLSRVGARGLMQLMPGTAAIVAARLGRPSPSPEDLFDPLLSLVLGSAELGRLSTAFDGFDAAAVAAYNAGEAQSRLWLDQCGPECDAARFVLTVTFDATRGYTADVLASTEVYGHKLKERSAAPDIALGSDQPSD